MGTSVVRFTTSESDELHWGVYREGKVFPLALAANHHRDVMQMYFDRRAAFDAAISHFAIAENDLVYQAPLSTDIQLICQGLNYTEHREEGGYKGQDPEAQNLIFQKGSSSICRPNSPIIRPAACELLDYEIELGLVCRRDLGLGAEVDDSNLPNYIGGLVLANDVSARDEQFGVPAMQWFRGKSFPTFCPLGPILYLLDSHDYENLNQLELNLSVNGEVRQAANTSQLIHKPAETLTELATFMQLRSGDCLLTGTPGGVALEMNFKSGLALMMNLRKDQKRRKKLTAAQLASGEFLKPGDELELTIRSSDGSINLGRQKNKVIEA
ncbi:MAG: fumarylacetoacetate hydrolase family protein [Pseudomonadales bacterium]